MWCISAFICKTSVGIKVKTAAVTPEKYPYYNELKLVEVGICGSHFTSPALFVLKSP
jgi:hypothetical protein